MESLEQRILLFGSPLFPEGLSDAPAADASGDQKIYLNFGGAQGVDYRGPVDVRGMDVPSFTAPAPWRGQEDFIVKNVLDSLNQTFQGSRVSFTSKQPTATFDYSTIYVGGDAAAFSDYGLYYGLAEQVDHGNLDHRDNAFVFSAIIPSSARSADDYGRELATYIAHEAGHLLGVAHEHDDHHSDDPLAEVAFKPYTHIESALDVRRDMLDDGMLSPLTTAKYTANIRSTRGLSRQSASIRTTSMAERPTIPTRTL